MISKIAQVIKINKGNRSGEEAEVKIRAQLSDMAVFEIREGGVFAVYFRAPDTDEKGDFRPVAVRDLIDGRKVARGFVDECKAVLRASGTERVADVREWGSPILAAIVAASEVLFSIS